MDKKIRTITQLDAEYPEALREIYDPPKVLYCVGGIKKEDADAVAIVGSRMCSAYGLRMAERLAFDLASAGLTIVSGMARGIDSAAHRGALRAGGRTIAVLGSGFGDIYPPKNRELFSKIAESGACLTEFPFDMPPLKYNFPVRNRIISGLSKGVVVVEASRKSGSLITARLALEQGRDVFAVPGMADSRYAEGTNSLIKKGACVATSAEDVLWELGIGESVHSPQSTVRGKSLLREPSTVDRGQSTDLSEEAGRVVASLKGPHPFHIDEIAISAGIDRNVLSAVLLKLELAGLVKELPGKHYEKVNNG